MAKNKNKDNTSKDNNDNSNTNSSANVTKPNTDKVVSDSKTDNPIATTKVDKPENIKKNFYDPKINKATPNKSSDITSSNIKTALDMSKTSDLSISKDEVENNNSKNKDANKIINRSNDSISDIATGLNLSPIDSVTGRIHLPFYSQVVLFNVCGFEGSILNAAFKEAVFELKQSPQWITNGSNIKGRISDDFLSTYFNYVGSLIALRTILLNFIYLYDDFHKHEKFKEDKVLTALLNPLFSTFVPRKKQYMSALESLNTHISEFYLPSFFIGHIENLFKVTSLPYHGNETLIQNSFNIAIPSKCLNRFYKFDSSDKSDLIVNFPFDKTIMGDYDKTFSNILNIVNFFNNTLSSSCSYDGEFNDIHSLFKVGVFEWKVTLSDIDSYQYTKHMSEADRISLLNSPLPTLDRVNSFNIQYDQYIGGEVFIDKPSILTKLSYKTGSSPLLCPPKFDVIIDDGGSNENTKPSFSRYYDNNIMWHDTHGGFNLEARDFINFSIPFKLNKDDSNCNINTAVLNEPGFQTLSNDSDGLNLTFGFVSDLVANVDSCINISPILEKPQIFNYFTSISKRSGHIYDFKIYDEKKTYTEYIKSAYTDKNLVNYINIDPVYISHPTLRKVSINFNLISNRLYTIFKEAWTSTSLLELYRSKNTLDIQTQLRVYKTIPVSSVQNTKNLNL